jgi:hypothetical protein
VAGESRNDQYRGNDKVMRERQRVEVLRCPLTRVHALITDRAAPPGALAVLRGVAVQTIVVDPETSVTEAA